MGNGSNSTCAIKMNGNEDEGRQSKTHHQVCQEERQREGQKHVHRHNGGKMSLVLAKKSELRSRKLEKSNDFKEAQPPQDTSLPTSYTLNVYGCLKA